MSDGEGVFDGVVELDGECEGVLDGDPVVELVCVDVVDGVAVFEGDPVWVAVFDGDDVVEDCVGMVVEGMQSIIVTRSTASYNAVQQVDAQSSPQ